MKRALILCLSLQSLSLLPAVGAAQAQTVVDGSDKNASPFVKSTLHMLSKRFAEDQPKFRKISTHTSGDKQIVCGEISLHGSKVPEAENFLPFGATQGEENPLVFEAHTIPAALDFREVNTWINHGADLEDLEEMGCVPEGSYRQYSDRLNAVLQHRKTN
ncbi:hypothetical protein [Acetobacter orleanensis]|uniref:Secreted protein n=1 Tax=Acetobacter orleanensis TaxID=104099 RepID=A0A4Y3TSC7_9PROT|nr:hypothetical protein [Acetobacter orleanensis]KXV66760.1 hypothetical protein AD949_01620 [Acetobacter orleanensis]GAN69541.1 hypothetical protein Abol_043_023 [Acetobacter orleanensis JCM 7639]GBR23445.1 hypothetical protein AA0473_0380 [Acetobacter orleanensis NRIC 0473]GEB83910.1 hypothetical protein AOR01nite_23870 [Acetobacter orleanensis]